MTKKKKEPSKSEATAIIYEKVIRYFELACIEEGIISTLNYVPYDTDIGTLNVAIQPKAAFLFVSSRKDQIELTLSDYLNYCNELNNTYQDFGFNELTIA